jgi:hypothetical protein
MPRFIIITTHWQPDNEHRASLQNWNRNFIANNLLIGAYCGAHTYFIHGCPYNLRCSFTPRT